MSEPDPHLHLRDLAHDPDLGPEAEQAGPIGPRGWHEVTLLAAVVLGGLLGTLARYELELAWPTAAGHFPTATLAINSSGAFLLGALLTVVLRPPPRHPLWRAFLGTGLLGGWTTYSTLAVESVTLVHHGHLGTALGYLAASLVTGLGAVALGMAVGRAVADRMSVAPTPAEEPA